jgi:hypothetical protein
MNKAHIGLIGFAVAVPCTLNGGSAVAELHPGPSPIIHAVPTFSCSPTVNGTNGIAHIAHTNAVAVDQTHDVVAIIKTPKGNVETAVCGKAFATLAQGTMVGAGFQVAANNEKDFIYTCEAHVGQGTHSCEALH